MKNRINRRAFLKKAGGTALGTTALHMAHPALAAAADLRISFASAWPHDASRPWPGPEYWPNPLQDWRVRNGRLECFSAGGDRNVALLTRNVAKRRGDLWLSVRFGRIDDALPERGFVGLRVGIKSPMNDYRATAIYGRGMNVGVNADGRLFIGSVEGSAPTVDLAKEISLQLHAWPSAAGYKVSLRATSSGGQAVEIARDVPGEWLIGGLVLVSSSGPVESTPVAPAPIKDFNFYPPNQHRGGTMRFWFADWVVGGSKVDEHEERAYGPILFTLYTVSRGTMKLSAQFPPLGNAPSTAMLQIRNDDGASGMPDPFCTSLRSDKTGTRGAFDGTREEAYSGADREPATAG
jgi:alkaline phosphatase D